jgi:hypothetical protein
VRSIEKLRTPANETSVAPAFVNGFTDGQAARGRNDLLTAYLRVGIDDYAKGYRAGYYTRASNLVTGERPIPRQVANL